MRKIKKRHVKMMAIIFSAALMFGTGNTAYAEEEVTDALEAVAEVKAALEAEDTEGAQAEGGEQQAEAEVEGELDVTPYVEEIEKLGMTFRDANTNEIPSERVAEAVDAIHQKAIDFKNEGIVTTATRRENGVYIRFVNNFEYTWEAGTDPAQEAETDSRPKVVLQPTSQQEERSTEETTRWSPEDPKNKVQQFKIAVPAGTIRYEFFYTAGNELPKITFLSTTAQPGNEYVVGTDVVMDGEDAFKFISKTGLKIEGHDDFRYMVVYISNTDDPGKWTMTVQAPETMTELIAVSSEVPEDWQENNSDVVTKPYGIIFWYVDSLRSVYKDQPIATINELIKAKTSLSTVDKFKDQQEEEPDYTNLYIALGVVGAVILIALIILLIIKARKRNNAAYREKRQKIVDKENEKVRKKKANENNELDDYLDNYSDEYIDDEDMQDYLSVDDSEGSESDMFADDADTGFYEGGYEAAKRVKDKIEDDLSFKDGKPAWLTNEPAPETASPEEQENEFMQESFAENSFADNADNESDFSGESNSVESKPTVNLPEPQTDEEEFSFDPGEPDMTSAKQDLGIPEPSQIPVQKTNIPEPEPEEEFEIPEGNVPSWLNDAKNDDSEGFF